MAILVVDDEDLPLLKRAFAASCPQRKIIGCTSAVDALAEVEKLTPDRLAELLIVTDLKMPGMDGKELIRSIRERWSPGPVIIALSTSSYRKDIDDVFAAGANAYHEKPMGYHETVGLCEQITTYWDSVRQPAPTPD